MNSLVSQFLLNEHIVRHDAAKSCDRPDAVVRFGATLKDGAAQFQREEKFQYLNVLVEWAKKTTSPYEGWKTLQEMEDFYESKSFTSHINKESSFANHLEKFDELRMIDLYRVLKIEATNPTVRLESERLENTHQRKAVQCGWLS